MLKTKFVRHSAIVDVTKSSLDTEIFNPQEMLGILGLRSIGYYMIKHGVFFQKNLSKYFLFESAGVICDQFTKL